MPLIPTLRRRASQNGHTRINKRARGGFLDTIFAPFRAKAKRESPRQTIGVGGASVYGGYLQTNETDSSLIGREKYKTFSEVLANTTIVGAGVRLFLNLVARASWKFEPADESAEAAEIAEAVERALLDEMTTPWHRVVRRGAMYRFHGFSIQEWTAKRLDDGSIGFLDVEPRPQITIERWDLDESGTVHGAVQRSPQTQNEIYIPRGRMVYAVDDSLHDSPEGLGIFRHIAQAARQLTRYQQLEGLGYETSLHGVPIGRGPFAEMQELVDKGNLTAAQKLAYEAGLKDFMDNRIYTEDRGILLDSKTYETTDERSTPSSVPMWNVELLQSSAEPQRFVAVAIERLNREIARLIGVEHILLGPTSGGGSSGSLALAKSKADSLALIVAGALQELGDTFEADLVAPMMDLNGWDRDLTPKMKPDAVQHRDVEQITGALHDLAQAGSAVGPQDEAFGEMFDLLGLTRPDVERMRRDMMLEVQDPTGMDIEPDPEEEGDGREVEEGGEAAEGGDEEGEVAVRS